MSTVELLQRVKDMSVRERQRFVSAVLQLEDGRGSPRKRRTERVQWPDVEARAKRIFGDRVLPNLVLTEREESAM